MKDPGSRPRFPGMRLLLWLPLLLFLVPTDSPAQMSPQTLTGTVTKTLNYLLYVPARYEQDPKESWPLVVFLHGYGERGPGLDKVKVHGPPKLAAAGKSFPFILAAPQCDGAWWEPEPVKILIEDLQKKLRVDPARIYLTGISMGGYGTWDTACRYPNLFAAIAPICGGGIPFLAGQNLAKMPIWCFHGAKDLTVPLSESKTMVDAVRAKGSQKVQFTVYPEASHDSWTQTYANDAFYEWLLGQRKENGKANAAPAKP